MQILTIFASNKYFQGVNESDRVSPDVVCVNFQRLSTWEVITFRGGSAEALH